MTNKVFKKISAKQKLNKEDIQKHGNYAADDQSKATKNSFLSQYNKKVMVKFTLQKSAGEKGKGNGRSLAGGESPSKLKKNFGGKLGKCWTKQFGSA